MWRVDGNGVRTIEAPQYSQGFSTQTRQWWMAQGEEVSRRHASEVRPPALEGRAAELSRIILRFMT